MRRSGWKKASRAGRALAWDELTWYRGELMPRVQQGGFRLRRDKADRAGIFTRYRAAEAEAAFAMARGRGKVTDAGADRFSCLYTRIPAGFDLRAEAEIEVHAFLRAPGPTNRESFGMFLRDTMEPDPETGEYYANMAAAGGYYGRYNVFGRTGITRESIETIRNFYLYQQVDRKGGAFEKEALHYGVTAEAPVRLRLVLEKKGGRVMARLLDPAGRDLLAPAENGGAAELAAGLRVTAEGDAYAAEVGEALSCRDRSWVYLGFHAADGSAITILKDTFRLTVLEPEACPAAQGTEVFADEQLGEACPAPASCGPAIEPRAFPGRRWIVSPAGSPEGDGTEQAPLDLMTAARYSAAADEILLQEGRYLLDGAVVLAGAASGANAAPGPEEVYGSGEASGSEAASGRKRFIGASGRVVLDFQGKPHALVIAGDGWDVARLAVTRGFGIIVEGSHNTVRHCRSYDNLETGILIRHPDMAAPFDAWPAGNLIEDCVSFGNRDASECNADGFACKVAAGEGNVFRRCTAFLNADDGFDLFSKNRRIGAVTIEDCESWLNGYRIGPDGALAESAGNGNGFKLGGSGLRVSHRVRGCTAAGNKGCGFTSNSNPALDLRACEAYDNAQENLKFYYYQARLARPRKRLAACSFEDRAGFDREELAAHLLGEYGER